MMILVHHLDQKARENIDDHHLNHLYVARYKYRGTDIGKDTWGGSTSNFICFQFTGKYKFPNQPTRIVKEEEVTNSIDAFLPTAMNQTNCSSRVNTKYKAFIKMKK